MPRNAIDLTHTLPPSFPFIPVQNKTFPFRIAPIATLDADGVYANRWEPTEHVGTHLDAPSHFAPGGASVDEIPVSSLMAPRAIASIEARVADDPDATFGLADLAAWEREHGTLRDGASPRRVRSARARDRALLNARGRRYREPISNLRRWTRAARTRHRPRHLTKMAPFMTVG